MLYFMLDGLILFHKVTFVMQDVFSMVFKNSILGGACHFGGGGGGGGGGGRIPT